MNRTWILIVTIAVASVLGGCAKKKPANEETAAATQEAVAQTPSQDPSVESPPAVADVKTGDKKTSPEQPKKIDKPKPTPPKEPEPEQPQVVNRDVTIPSGTEFTIALREKVSTEGGKPGQPFTGVTKESVRVEGLDPIPAGSVVSGEVVSAERAGRVGGKAKLALTFNKIDLPDGKSYPITARTLRFEGEGTAKGDVEKVVGGAVGGGILGGILGGKKGAGEGAAAGTIAGGIFAVATRGNDIVFDPGKDLKVTLDAPLTIPMTYTVAPGQNP